MPELLKIDRIAQADAAGVWVGAERYGNDLPSEDAVKFVIARSQKGNWSVAVRGYEDGQQIPSVVAGYELAAKIEGKEHPTLGWDHRMIAVDNETGAKYLELVTKPEVKFPYLLIHMLEHPTDGVWGVMSPALYNDYETFAKVTIDGPSVSYRAASDGYIEQPTESIPAKIAKEGPIYTVHNQDSGVVALSSSAIADRVLQFPTLVSYTKPSYE